MRHPGGEQELEPGDVVCFPVGPDGAHKVTNRAEDTARVIIFSTQIEPSVAVYPDSDKIGVWPGDKRDNVMVRPGATASSTTGTASSTRAFDARLTRGAR